MNIQVEVRNHTARIMLEGRFTYTLRRKFIGAYVPLIKDSDVHSIEIEMNKVDYLDTSALGMLMLLSDRANVPHKPVTLLNPSDVVSQFLELANFSRFFMIKPTNEVAGNC